MEQEINNRVANSSLITLDLETYYHQGERVFFDMAPLLFQGLILKEKDFREFVKAHDWAAYTDKNVAIGCTQEAIVPVWAYMLVATKLAPSAHKVVFGSLEQLEQALFQYALSAINPEEFRDEKVIIKGCSKYPVPVFAYVEIAAKLQPVVASLMYGEACSNVPLFKKPKAI
jgi:hypothetical protein